jgi:hypothetical protein
MKIRAYLKKKNEIKKFKRAIDRKIFLLSKYIYIYTKMYIKFFFSLTLKGTRTYIFMHICICIYKNDIYGFIFSY